MIKDNLNHIEYYNYLTREIQLGLNYLKDTDFTNVNNGKYEVLKDKIFAIVQDYTSKPEAECKFEAHRKHIDIQFIALGEEKIGVGKSDDFIEITEYEPDKDIIFLTPKAEAKVDFVKLISGEFLILTPQDAHMPSLTTKEPCYVKKVVVKVSI